MGITIEKISSDLIESLNNQAYVLCKSKKYYDAILNYNRALELCQYSNPILINNRGNVYMELQHYEKAIEDFTWSITLNPNVAMTYFNRAAAYAELRNLQFAITDAKSAVHLAPQNQEYCKFLARLERIKSLVYSVKQETPTIYGINSQNQFFAYGKVEVLNTSDECHIECNTFQSPEMPEYNPISVTFG
jgi:tetratricopeptide (TPR) repeat protein